MGGEGRQHWTPWNTSAYQTSGRLWHAAEEYAGGWGDDQGVIPEHASTATIQHEPGYIAP